MLKNGNRNFNNIPYRKVFILLESSRVIIYDDISKLQKYNNNKLIIYVNLYK